jgi:hypothetical protein
MAHTHCILNTSGYNHTLRICNIWCFSPKKWLHERVSVLLCACIACLFFLVRNVVYTFRFEINLLITRRCRGSGCCRWSVTTEVRVLFRVSPREICGAQSDSGESFIPVLRFLPSESFQKCCIVNWILQLSEEQAGETWHLKTNWLSYIGELRVEEYEDFHSILSENSLVTSQWLDHLVKVRRIMNIVTRVFGPKEKFLATTLNLMTKNLILTALHCLDPILRHIWIVVYDELHAS